MRKRVITEGIEKNSVTGEKWLDVVNLALAEVSSEDTEHPIESAVIPNTGPGWRAAGPGRQTIRLLFDEPQEVRKIHLAFQQDEHECTQEFVLRWSADNGKSYREIARQQYNFSPHGTTREIEDYAVDLNGLTTLEVIVNPDISGGSARAFIAELHLA